MKKVFSVFLILSVAITCLIPGFSIRAQQTGGTQVMNRAAQYYLGMGDELLVPVNIWGFILKPGQYMVPNRTDLISLLSFAGGPSEGAKISNVKIVRSDPKLGNTIIKVDVKKYLKTADQRLIPTLKPGDTIVVKGTTFNWIRQFIGFISNLAIFTTMWYYISRASN